MKIKIDQEFAKLLPPLSNVVESCSYGPFFLKYLDALIEMVGNVGGRIHDS